MMATAASFCGSSGVAMSNRWNWFCRFQSTEASTTILSPTNGATLLASAARYGFVSTRTPASVPAPPPHGASRLNAAKTAATLNHITQMMERTRSEEHTSELQSLMRSSYAVFCLKKNNINYYHILYHVPLH